MDALWETSDNWDEDTCAKAARGGHLAVLQGRDTMAADGMAIPAPGQLKEATWQCYSACSLAAYGGHLAVLQWRDTMAAIEWARHSGCSWDEDTCTNAASGGHLAVLQWARENNCPWSGSTTFVAAFNNHLDVMKWARQQR
eukprot:jgi/Astpho2/9475/Aster-01728